MRLLILSLLLICSAWVSAQELNTFSNGEVADAEKINENFELLSNDVEGLLSWQEQQLGKAFLPDYGGIGSFHAIDVDCDQDPSALDDAFYDFIEYDRLRLNIRGTCVVADPYPYATAWRHLWLAGEGSYGEDCANNTTLQLAEDATSSSLVLGTVAGSLWLSCLTFDVPYTLITSYGHGYLRFEKGVRAKEAAQQLAVQVRANSTFRTFQTNRIDNVVVRNNSLAYFQTSVASVDIGSLVLRGGSMFTCRACRDVIIESAQLRHGSKMTFMRMEPGYSSIQIDNLNAAQRSQINIERNSESGELDISIPEQTLIEDSVIFESVFGQ